jgi:hypothetical protein
MALYHWFSLCRAFGMHAQGKTMLCLCLLMIRVNDKASKRERRGKSKIKGIHRKSDRAGLCIYVIGYVVRP